MLYNVVLVSAVQQSVSFIILFASTSVTDHSQHELKGRTKINHDGEDHNNRMQEVLS